MKINYINNQIGFSKKVLSTKEKSANTSRSLCAQQNSFQFPNYSFYLVNFKSNLQEDDLTDEESLNILHQRLVELNKKSKTDNQTSKPNLKGPFYDVIKSIALALDSEDKYTRGHSMRVTLYSILLAKELGVSQTDIEKLEIASLLHDIGKVGISEEILQKPTGLTDEEYEIMKTHSENAEKIITGIKKLENIIPIVRHHHERWDGRGYPDKLQGEEIPFFARIIALADTYDAMTSTRSYRKALSHDEAIKEIKKCAGTQFDPILAEKFIEIQNKIKAAKENPDEFYLKNLKPLLAGSSN